MRLISFTRSGRSGFGRLVEDGVEDWSGSFPGVRAALAAGALEDAAAAGGPVLPLAELTLLPPVPDPGKIICAGVNYHAHRDEASRPAAEYPTLFSRFADSQIADGAPALIPAVSDRLDYEGELAVVIGSPVRGESEKDAWASVTGYSCYNDFSVRDWQRHTSQWLPGKNFTGTGAFGPCLVTADELPDITASTLTTTVNGELRQQAQVSDLIFSIPQLITYISTFTTLQPGDVLVTGTPGGVGLFRDPPVFLQADDLVEVEITGVGRLSNPVQPAVALDRGLAGAGR